MIKKSSEVDWLVDQLKAGNLPTEEWINLHEVSKYGDNSMAHILLTAFKDGAELEIRTTTQANWAEASITDIADALAEDQSIARVGRGIKRRKEVEWCNWRIRNPLYLVDLRRKWLHLFGGWKG